MKISRCGLNKYIAAGLVLIFAVPLSSAAAAQQSATDATAVQPVPAPKMAPAATGSSPDGPNAQPAAQPNEQQPGPGQQNITPPVGTATAPYEKTVGSAATRPTGVVIAPAKQRRSRAILIRVGLIVGAAVAVGTVAGLSRSSSSTPH
jgi:hypothetical protein